jgi:hypothetical protein
MTTEETLAPNFVKLDGRVASREDQKRALARLLIARTDLSAAQFALKTILTQMTKGLRDPLIYPLHTAAIICYARPFTRNKETGTLPATYSRFDSDEANAAHRDALDVRHKFVAHSDFDARRPRIYPAGWKVGTDSTGREIGDKHVNADVQTVLLGRRVCIRLHDNCIEILNRLHADIDEMLQQLYGGMDLPTRPFALRIDAGL